MRVYQPWQRYLVGVLWLALFGVVPIVGYPQFRVEFAAGALIGASVMVWLRSWWHPRPRRRGRWAGWAPVIGAAGGPLLAKALQGAVGQAAIMGPALFACGLLAAAGCVLAFYPLSPRPVAE